jgi:hypothetical protein
MKWAFIHAALILFAADLVAAFCPAFDAVWTGHAKIVIGLASLSASIVEYLEEHKETVLLKRYNRRKAWGLQQGTLDAEPADTLNDLGKEPAL